MIDNLKKMITGFVAALLLIALLAVLGFSLPMIGHINRWANQYWGQPTIKSVQVAKFHNVKL